MLEVMIKKEKNIAFNRLLKRQVRRYLGDMDNLTPEMMKFLEAVNRSYNHYEEDRLLLERSMDISSEELRETNQRLKEEAEKQKTILGKLKNSLRTLLSIDIGFQNVEIQNDEDVLEIIEVIDNQSKQIKKVEEELLLIQSFIDQSNDAIQVADINGKMIFVNNKAEQWLGKPKHELYKNHIEDVDNKFDKYKRTWSRLLATLKDQDLIILEREQILDNGEVIPVESSIKSITVNNQKYFIGVSRDITERKLAQEKQEKLINDLKIVNEDLENFAYIVSHDLKAPLRGIGSLTDMIIMDNEEILDEDSMELLTLVKSRVHRMTNLITGVLTYSKVGISSEQKTNLDLNELVEEVVDLLAPPDHFAVDIQPDLPTIHNEGTKVRQLFQNFISNAIKYNDKEKGEIRITCTDEGDFWEFGVHDNGPGIDEKYHDKIFQIFETLEKKDKIESTGIGLTIVKKIIKANNGKVRLESKLGKGSSFYFTLPKK